MEKKRRILAQLSDAGQDVMELLQSPEAGGKIEAATEELAHRWDNLVQKLEDCSFQVCIKHAESGGFLLIRPNDSVHPDLTYDLSNEVMEAVTDAGIPQEDEQVIIDTVAVGAAASVTGLDLTPPASAEKQRVGMDPEVTRM